MDANPKPPSCRGPRIAQRIKNDGRRVSRRPSSSRESVTYFLRVRDAPKPAAPAKPRPSRSRVVGSGTAAVGARTLVTLSANSLPLSLSAWPACGVRTPGPPKVDLMLYVPRKTSSVEIAELPKAPVEPLYVHVRLGRAALSATLINDSAGPVLALENVKSAHWFPAPPHVWLPATRPAKS